MEMREVVDANLSDMLRSKRVLVAAKYSLLSTMSRMEGDVFSLVLRT